MKKIISLLLMVSLFFTCAEKKKQKDFVDVKGYLEVKYADTTIDTLTFKMRFTNSLERPIIYLNDKGCLKVGQETALIFRSEYSIACDVRTWKLLKVEEIENN